MSGRQPLFSTIKADMEAYAKETGRSLSTPIGVIDVLMIPGVVAVMLFRFASFFHQLGVRPLSRLIYFLNLVLFGADLTPGAKVGPGLVIPHPVGVAFGDVVIGKNARLMGLTRVGAITSRLGDDVWMMDSARVLGPSIGDRCVIGANATVLDDMPADAVVVGTPARVAHLRTDPESSVPLDPEQSADG